MQCVFQIFIFSIEYEMYNIVLYPELWCSLYKIGILKLWMVAEELDSGSKDQPKWFREISGKEQLAIKYIASFFSVCDV